MTDRVAPSGRADAETSLFDHPDTRRRVTVLEGVYATGDFECFCFDKVDDPSGDERHHHEQNAQRVYPNSLLPAGTYSVLGDWRITVEFVPRVAE